MEDVTVWAELDEEDCPCKGDGWRLCEDWEQCPIHYHGQLHPLSRELLMDDPKLLAEEERKSQIRYQLDESRARLNALQVQIRQEQYQISMLELELINRTPTVKMPAVAMSLLKPDVVLTIENMDP